MNVLKAELEEFFDRYALGLVEDIELAEFLDRHVITKEEHRELRRRKISTVASFTGRYDCTHSNEKYIGELFKLWNERIAAMCQKQELSVFKIFSEE